MTAKVCKRYVQKLFQQEEPNRHDEDLPAADIILYVTQKFSWPDHLNTDTPTHPHHGAFYVSVSP